MAVKLNKSSTPAAPARQDLMDLLNDDLAREYQAVIAYAVYSQVIKGASYMNIAAVLEVHAAEELQHAITLANQIDYLGGMPAVTSKAVKLSDQAEDMLRFDLDNENETIRNYRQRVRQCEALGEYALAEHLRQILMQEQDHQIALATALGEDVPDVTGAQERAESRRGPTTARGQQPWHTARQQGLAGPAGRVNERLSPRLASFIGVGNEEYIQGRKGPDRPGDR